MSTSLMVFGAVGWVVLIVYLTYCHNKEKAAKPPTPVSGAYQIAVAHGYKGTYKEWLRELSEPRRRLKKGKLVHWDLEYNLYFDHYNEQRPRYTDPFGCSYVLRIPLMNPYYPYSVEHGEHEFPSNIMESYEEWAKRAQKEYIDSMEYYSRSELRKQIRQQVTKRIQIQHRHPARQHVAKV